ncbi:MAG: sugar transporter ATP-binding protein [Nocardioides sp.]|nr:sugar transporter ATP-binding protein [Nocardioides sp.]
MTTARAELLTVKGLGKQFSGIWVLRDVDLEVRRGEIVGLVGENGSGKSTLVKILTGFHNPDSGTVRMGAQELTLPIRQPQDLGIAVIHQDLGLIETMTVAENLGISSSYGARALAPVRNRQEERLCRELLEGFGVDVDIHEPVATLAPSVRSAVAIARSIRVLRGSAENHLLILDEPTAYLGHDDSLRVRRLMRSAADNGAGVIFISHHLDEVTQSCDRIVVLRDGQLVDTFDVGDVQRSEVIAAMLGRSLDRFYPEPRDQAGDTLISFRGVAGGQTQAFDLDLHAGEVVGVTGLVGSGFHEVPYLLAGLLRATGGSVDNDGSDILGLSPNELLLKGVAVVPGNRQRDGVWLEGTAQENVTLLQLKRFFRWPTLRLAEEEEEARALMAQYGVRPLDPTRRLDAFSGGNQQKMVMAKWLSTNPKVMLLDEPTQGVDAGARRDILDIVASAAEAGSAVAIFSADLEQLAEMCDRVVVMAGGRVQAVLSSEEATQASILTAAHG